MNNLIVSTEKYGYKDFKPLFEGPVKIKLTTKSISNVKKSHSLLKSNLDNGQTIYGVNTGFGNLSQIKIDKKDLQKLQINLARSHSSGVGDPLEKGIVRTIFFLKLLTFVKGYSGVRLEVLEKIIQFINNDILPIIPCKGSVGASGDLNPLGHMTLCLVGEGEVLYQGERMHTAKAMQKANISPLILKAKEGLSLINGTQLSTALAIKALIQGEYLLKTSDIAAALSVENSFSSKDVFRKEIHELKMHHGQRVVAKNIYYLLEKSEIVNSHRDCGKIQDPYSFRCVPHIHGASRDAYYNVTTVVNNEINSVSDNPIILKNGKIVSSGHFHAEHISQAMDQLSVALTEIGAVSERRVHFFMKGIDSRVPQFVASNPGIESGYMLSHVTASALVSENKTLSFPASVDSLPTSGGQEDLVSMAPWAGYKVLNIQKNLSYILGIELIVSGAANHISSPNLRSGKGTHAVLKFLKNNCHYDSGDRSLNLEIENIAEKVLSGKIIGLSSKYKKLEL